VSVSDYLDSPGSLSIKLCESLVVSRYVFCVGISWEKIVKMMWHAFKKHDGQVVVADFFGAKGNRYKLFWIGGKERSDGVGIFVAEK